MRTEIRIAGFGGQGVGLAGYILGKAGAIFDGREVVMTQSYGPEARGGASSASVVISDQEIAYPFVQQPDILVALSQEAYRKFSKTAGPLTFILTDSDLVESIKDSRHHDIPATRMAEGLGRRIVANMVMLGFLIGVTDILNRKAVEEAIKSTVKPKTVELNLRAFVSGIEYKSEKMRV
jgi:2-oxoglutarate ferredoxin oxidoreductase subunit gamma